MQAVLTTACGMPSPALQFIDALLSPAAKTRLLLPAAVEIVLESDLVDSCKPGDRVAVVGIFRPLASASGGSTSGAYRCVPAHGSCTTAEGCCRLGTDDLTCSPAAALAEASWPFAALAVFKMTLLLVCMYGA